MIREQQEYEDRIEEAKFQIDYQQDRLESIKQKADKINKPEFITDEAKLEEEMAQPKVVISPNVKVVKYKTKHEKTDS